MNEEFTISSELRSMNDMQLEKYLESGTGLADSRLTREILIRLFKARRVTVDDLMDAYHPKDTPGRNYSGRNWTKDAKCPNCGQRFYT